MLGPGLVRCAGWRVDILLGSQERGVLEGRGQAPREEATIGKASLPVSRTVHFCSIYLYKTLGQKLVQISGIFLGIGCRFLKTGWTCNTRL